jgi:PBP1b-binding outer membrane lipoprotein LpoB
MDSAKVLSVILGALLLAGCGGGEAPTQAGQSSTAGQALSSPNLPPEAKAELERLSAAEQAQVAEAKKASEARKKAESGG